MRTEKSSSKSEINKYKLLARRVIAHHLGKPARRVEYKAAGLTNFVFAVKHAEGNFIVRIAPQPASIDKFRKEQWAQKAAAGAGVPVPEIFEVGLAEIGLPYIISAAAKGREAVHHENRFAVLGELGRYASIINSIRTRGFGETFDWSENKLSRNGSFQDYLENEFCYTQRLETLRKHKMLTRTQVSSIRKTFESAAGTIKTRPVLNHGDLRLKNVLVDNNGKIVAIIDWENSTSNIAPAWELSFALHDLGVDAKQYFIEGYGLSDRALNEASPLIKGFNILNYAPEVDGAAARKDRKMVDRIRQRFTGVLDLYTLNDG
jgi:aminoglycoside phosphotransferase (APT) family kinase protein